MSKQATYKEVKQSKNGTHTQYRFYEGHLQYQAKSDDGEFSFIVPYTGVSANKRVTKVRKPIILWAGIAFWALGAARFLTDFFANASWWAGLTLLTIAAIISGVYFLRQFSFTGVATARGQMAVLHDKQHDKLIDMLMDRRKKQLLAQYRQTNYGNTQVRRQAIQWLWENEVISETEYQSMIQEISSVKKSSPTFTGKLMN